jgi:peroxiredoxin Q/BCP
MAGMASGVVNLLAGRGERRPRAIEVGDKAPDFALLGSDGRLHRLSDSAGCSAVVLAWFPRAFTGGCTIECRSLVAAAAALSREGVRYYAASVDPPEVNREFAEALDARFPILSDPSGETARAYGVLGPAAFARRWTFYIDMAGDIRAIDRQVRAASHGTDVAARLDALNLAGRD